MLLVKGRNDDADLGQRLEALAAILALRTIRPECRTQVTSFPGEIASTGPGASLWKVSVALSGPTSRMTGKPSIIR